MKVDTLIKQRFVELEQKADVVRQTRNAHDIVASEKFKEWATNVMSLFQRVFGEDSVHFKGFCDQYRRFRGTVHQFEDCWGVFQAGREDYEGGYLFDVRALVKAEDSVTVLEQATELLQAEYKDPACILAGVALEIALRELCTRNNISHAKLNAMNAELCKKGVYNTGVQMQVTGWAHWRNKAAHGEWGEYTSADVEGMIEGITRFVADYV